MCPPDPLEEELRLLGRAETLVCALWSSHVPLHCPDECLPVHPGRPSLLCCPAAGVREERPCVSIGRWPGTGWALVRRASWLIAQIALPSSSGLRPSFAVLLLLSATWLLALLSVNSDTLLFHYLFAACNCVQVPGPTLPSKRKGTCLGVGCLNVSTASLSLCLPGPLHLPFLRGAQQGGPESTEVCLQPQAHS